MRWLSRDYIISPPSYVLKMNYNPKYKQASFKPVYISNLYRLYLVCV